MTQERPTTTVSGINAVLQVAERFGVRRQQLLTQAQLEPEWLRHREDRLPVGRLFDVYRAAAQLSGRDDIGLYAGRINYFTGLSIVVEQIPSHLR